MIYSHEVLPVFVIEDNDEHAAQITAKLESGGYSVRVSSTGSRVELYSYKAWHRDSQIVIVDLDLGLTEETDPQQGYSLIRDQIWPYDRTTLFIVFSEYIELRSATLGQLDPHWCFVSKNVERQGQEAGEQACRLSEECLEELLRVVTVCAEAISPKLTVPLFESYMYLREINQYNISAPQGIARYEKPVQESVVKSISVLNDLARAAVPFERAGASAKGIAIGVYGSCGRLEMRKDSDIEFRGSLINV